MPSPEQLQPRGMVALATCADVGDPRSHDLPVQRLEPELGAARGEGLDDAGHVVAYEEEARHSAVCFHRAPQCVLGVLLPCNPTGLQPADEQRRSMRV